MLVAMAAPYLASVCLIRSVVAVTHSGFLSTPRADASLVSVHTQTNAEAAMRQAFFAIVDPAIDASLDGSAPQEALSETVRKGAAVLDAQIVSHRLAASMPSDVASLIKSLPAFVTEKAGSSASQKPADLDPKAVQKAINKLNDMIAKAQARYDLKDVECMEFKERSDETQTQVATDLARLAETLSDLKETEIDANSNIQAATGSIENQKEEQANAGKAYRKQLKDDQAQLAIHKADLKVTEFMLALSRCKEGAALAQMSAQGASTQFETCDDGTNSPNFTFDDERLESSKSKLSSQAQELLRFALARASALSGGDAVLHAVGLAYGNDVDLDDGDDGEQDNQDVHAVLATTHQQLTKSVTDPVTAKKQGKRCANAKPDCGVLHDTFASLWGEMKDAVEDLSKKIEDDTNRWKQLDKAFNDELDSLRTEKDTMSKHLASTQAANAAETEVQGQKQEEKIELEETHKKTMAECKATKQAILYDEICGTISVRNKFIEGTLKIKDADIVDCAVSEWTPSECSVPCDDKEVGGLQLLTRDVITGEKNHGSACPLLNMTKRCGQHKCAIDCKLSEWEDYSKCTKECGGGVQTRTRMLEVKPKNGGKHCDALQETRNCNTGSCDRDCALADWTTFSECSQACNSGFSLRSRSVVVSERGRGKCWADISKERLQRQSCNTQACVGDEVCVAARDVVIAIDGSGSITEKGFDVLKEFALKIVARFRARAYGQEAVNVAIVQFGNGHLQGSIVSDAILAMPLSNDLAAASKAIESLTIKKGFTNMAQGFMKASAVLKRSMRKNAAASAIFITDGKPSFKSTTRTAVNKLKETSTVLIAHVKSFPKKENEELMKSYASAPTEVNYALIPGKKALKSDFDAYVTKVIARMCPGAESPSAMGLMVEQQGFEQLKDGFICPGKPQMTQKAATAAGCTETLKMEWAMFAFKAPSSSAEQGECLIYSEPCFDFEEAPGYTLYERSESDEADVS
eukprot:TRINITY_DN14716_c0_g5_i1.p1 TRINITY_DN14716_c0_g5~~TRINITY_DN14716_c0_g5_i1.p1  ORF type:complete len:979 (+),score=209.38 TRINITY_DN14716_c0_g5_i1:73-3009(+)